jgi:hypothetical protein
VSASIGGWLNGLNWGAISGVCAVLAVFGGLARWVVGEVRKAPNANAETLGEIKRKVTTPDSVPGTIGETVAGLSVDADAHRTTDDERFGRVWDELGKPEPG